MDRISLLGLELWARVGCTPEERAFPQRLEADVDMALSLRAAGAKDDLKRSVDYADAAARIRRMVQGEEYKLAEAVAEKIARLVREAYRVKRVTVRIRKRALAGLRDFEVEITRP